MYIWAWSKTDKCRARGRVSKRNVAKHAFEAFANVTKMSKPLHSTKMAWHNFTVTVFRFHSTLSSSLPLLSWFFKTLNVLCWPLQHGCVENDETTSDASVLGISVHKLCKPDVLYGCLRTSHIPSTCTAIFVASC